jgi:hypothetical protein
VKIILFAQVVPGYPRIDVGLGDEVRYPAFVQDDVDFGIVTAVELQVIHVNAFFKGFSMDQLAEHTAVGLVVEVFDVGAVKEFGDGGNACAGIHIKFDLGPGWTS